MKKRFAVILMILVLAAVLLSVSAFAADAVQINASNFPDETFRSYVKENFDTNGDGTLSADELAAVDSISVFNKGVTSIKGIEYFTQLKSLICSENRLYSIDISKNTCLTELWCDHDQLSSLDLTNNTQLEILLCNHNSLSSLDVSKNPRLTRLCCFNNYLTDLDVTNNTELTTLTCQHNEISALNVRNNKKLTLLYCYYNKLSSLNVTNNTALTELFCGANDLTSLDVSRNSALQILSCSETSIDYLDLTNCPKINKEKLVVEPTTKVFEFAVCPSVKFKDAPKKGNWAHEGIDYCIANEYMNGTGNGLFSPAGTVTRAQLVTIIYRIEGEPETEFKGTFDDVADGKFYSKAVEWAAVNGIVNGIEPGKFNPMGNITREQIATILYRYEGSPAVSTALTQFPDANLVHSYAEKALAWSTEVGLINGIKDGSVTNLAPQKNATRAQIAAIIMRLLGGSCECG